MSHHFDTPTAKEDPRINVCDFYLFRGRPGTTVMALTVNPNAGVDAPDTFRDEGLYAFRFDTNRDLREDVAFKVQFGAPAHADGGEHRHVQTFAVRRATGADALKGAAGELIISGNTGRVVKADQGCLAYAGLAPDLFASDGAGFGAFRKALWSENRFAPEAFQNRQNFFGGKNVTAIVLRVPSSLIGRGAVHAWATASLYGHAPEVQVSRWGLPMITHLLLSDPSLHDASENYNRAVPADGGAPCPNLSAASWKKSPPSPTQRPTHPPTLRNSSRACAHRSCPMNWTRPPHSALPPSTAAASATTRWTRFSRWPGARPSAMGRRPICG